jgi:broad specificity phosphatase PhoE
MTVLIARHAQSAENLRGKGALGALPQIEIPLTEAGEEQAAVLGKKLARWCLEQEIETVRIYASPYQRVRDTSRFVMLELRRVGVGLTFVSDHHLSEVDFLPRDSALTPGRVLFDDRALASETVAGVERRLGMVASEIRRDEKAGLPVIVLTHSTVMRGLAALLAGLPFTDVGKFPRPDNCSLWQIDGQSIAQSIFPGYAPPARKQAREDEIAARSLAGLTVNNAKKTGLGRVFIVSDFSWKNFRGFSRLERRN